MGTAGVAVAVTYCVLRAVVAGCFTPLCALRWVLAGAVGLWA